MFYAPVLFCGKSHAIMLMIVCFANIHGSRCIFLIPWLWSWCVLYTKGFAKHEVMFFSCRRLSPVFHRGERDDDEFQLQQRCRSPTVQHWLHHVRQNWEKLLRDPVHRVRWHRYCLLPHSLDLRCKELVIPRAAAAFFIYWDLNFDFGGLLLRCIWVMTGMGMSMGQFRAKKLEHVQLYMSVSTRFSPYLLIVCFCFASAFYHK